MRHVKLLSLVIIATLAGLSLILFSDAFQGDANDTRFFLNMIEVKGSTGGISAPEVDPATLSAGYRYVAPGEFDPENSAKWQVSSYFFSDSSMVVNQGERVVLTLFGVNGDTHLVWVESPSGEVVVATTTMNRGREYTIEFTAEESGYYRLVCGNHAPTMAANILAIPAAN